jgi:hypothetical protein
MTEPIQVGIGFQKWPKIGSLKNVLYHFAKIEEFALYGVAMGYRPKPKLHGTNAAIRVYNQGATFSDDRRTPILDLRNRVDAIGEVFSLVAQSRNKDITTGKHTDNYGFAAWVADNYESFRKTFKVSTEAACTTFFGEWAGQGILNGAAICAAPRGFHVYAVQYQRADGEIYYYETEPDMIELLLEDTMDQHDDIHVLPWMGKELTINAFRPETCQMEVNHINSMVSLGAEADLYTKKLYDIDGPLEGLVYYPTSMSWVPQEDNERPMDKLINKIGSHDWLKLLLFKAKVEGFRVTKTAAAVEIDLGELKSREDFIDVFCTENRMKQALEEAGAIDIKDTGKFVQWVCKDVHEESQVERAEADLDWDKLSRYVAKSASLWFRSNL